MIRADYPFFHKRYAYNISTNIIHDLKNETPECKIDEMDEEDIEMYSSLNEQCLIMDHTMYKKCPHCFKDEK